MAEIKIDLDEYELDEITVGCPYKKADPDSFYSSTYHEHTDERPHDYPCHGYGKGPGIITLLKYLANKVAELDAQLNPPPPKPEPKPKRVQARKVKK